MNSVPLVGVSTSRRTLEESGVIRHYVSQSYTRALSASGAIPVLIPNDLDEDAVRTIYERVDGVLLTGGGDVAPQHFGAAASNLILSVDDGRDQTEFWLSRWAYEQDKPLLAICRGIQAMNVALGGSLVIDVPTMVGPEIPHHFKQSPGSGRSTLLHEVQLTPGTVIGDICQSDQIQVNSIHHQAIEKVASGLQPTACAPDGVIEGAEAAGARFFMGVQWHPEEIFDITPETPALFRAFTAAL